jgi:hypothetical protein
MIMLFASFLFIIDAASLLPFAIFSLMPRDYDIFAIIFAIAFSPFRMPFSISMLIISTLISSPFSLRRLFHFADFRHCH